MASANTTLIPGTVLGNKWRLGQRLGAGACADVFDVESITPAAATASGPVSYVAKCIALPTGNAKGAAYKERNRVCDTLFYEYTLYTNGVLYGFEYAPKIPPGAYGNDKGHRYLIMEKLDFDLKQLASRSAPRLTVARIAEIGLDVLAGLEFIHKKGFLFVDVKPENFMIKITSSGEEKLRFIDFGLMEKFTQYMSGGGQRERGSRAVVAGTHLYASLAVLRGEVPSRRDDVEAMGYMLLSLATPFPWDNASSEADLLRKKEACDIDALATQANCAFLGRIIHLCRETSYENAPDYAAIRKLLQQGTKVTTPVGGAATIANRRTSAGRRASRGREEEISRESVATASSVTTAAQSSAASATTGSSTASESVTTQRKGRGKAAAAAETIAEEPRKAPPAKKTKAQLSPPEIEIDQAPTKAATTARGRKTAVRSVESTVDLTIESDEEVQAKRTPKRRRGADSNSAVAVSSAVTKASTPSTTSRGSFILDAPAAVCEQDSIASPPSKRRGRPVKSIVEDAVTNKAPPLEIVLKAQGGLFGEECFPVRGSYHSDAKPTKAVRRSSLDLSDCTIIGRLEESGTATRMPSNHLVRLDADDYVSERHAAVQCMSDASGGVGIRVRDLESTNGVKLNGKKIPANEWVTADLGDVLKIGQTKFTVSIRKAVR